MGSSIAELPIFRKKKINWYVNNRRQDREKHSLPSFDSCPFLWTAHRFLPIEQNRVTSADTVWSFNRFPSSWFYQRFYTLETDSIIYSKVVTCLIEWRVHLISLHSDGCFSVFKFLRSSQHVVSSKRQRKKISSTGFTLTDILFVKEHQLLRTGFAAEFWNILNAVEKLPAVSHLFFLVPTGKQAIVANSDKTFREHMH